MVKGDHTSSFNGAFKSKGTARRLKRKIANGFIVRRKVDGEMRFLVMSKNNGRGKNK
jgi:hypothetical protein